MEEFMSQFLTEKKDFTPKADRMRVIPAPGLCAKLKRIDGTKVFVNICTSEHVPLPDEISETELIKMLEDTEVAPPYRIPLSISEPQEVLDNAGSLCNAHDIIIHPKFLTRINSSEVFKAFLMTVILEGLMNKFKLDLQKDWIILKNKKCIGTLQEQFIRTKARPAIIELDQAVSPQSEIPNEVQNKLIKSVAPEMNMIAVPDVENMEFIVAEIKLPELSSLNGLYLDIGSKALSLKTRSGVYELAAKLHYPVNADSTVAEFNHDTKMLTITMPILSECHSKKNALPVNPLFPIQAIN